MPVKVSICIPAYNQVEFLKKNLASIAMQTYTNFDVIITDDSTTGEVEKLVKDFFADKPLAYTYYHNQPALGSPANWNKAVSLASGEYIKLLHHDDWLINEHSLEEFVSALDEHPEADLAFCTSSILDVSKNVYRENRPDAAFLNRLKQNPLTLFNDNRVGAPTAVIYRASVNKQFDEKISYVVDLDFYIRVLQHNPNFVFIDQPLIVNTSNHAGQVTATFVNSKKQTGEYCYLYNKLFHGKFPKKKYRVFFQGLFYWQQLNSFTELEEMGYPRPRPTWLFNYLLVRARHQRKAARANQN